MQYLLEDTDTRFDVMVTSHLGTEREYGYPLRRCSLKYDADGTITVRNSFRTLIAKVMYTSVDFGEDIITIIGKQIGVTNNRFIGDARLELHPHDED